MECLEQPHRSAAGSEQPTESPLADLAERYDLLCVGVLAESRGTTGLRRAMRENVWCLSGEWRETRTLVQTLLWPGHWPSLPDGELRSHVKEQAVDLLRGVAAALVAIVNAVLPIPGSGWFTPALLAPLGLLPSRWREVRALKALGEQEQRFRQEGRIAAAERIAELRREVISDVEELKRLAREARLISCWDVNGDGVLDAAERDAYVAEVRRLASWALQQRYRRLWFCQDSDVLVGPLRFTDLAEIARGDLLVVPWGSDRWVRLGDVMKALHQTEEAESETDMAEERGGGEGMGRTLNVHIEESDGA